MSVVHVFYELAECTRHLALATIRQKKKNLVTFPSVEHLQSMNSIYSPDAVPVSLILAIFKRKKDLNHNGNMLSNISKDHK